MDLRRSVNTKIWDDIWFSELSHDEKLLWLYLLTNSFTNMLGVYEISERKIVFDTGLTLDRVRKAFESFERLKKAKYYSGYIILYNWIKNQSYNKNMITSALNALNDLPSNVKISIYDRFSTELERKLLTLSKGSKAFQILPKIEKEKEIEKEVENEKVTNKVFTELSKSDKWLEETAYFYKTDISFVVEHLRKFYHHCKLTDNFKFEIKEVKTHFKNWVEKGNPIPQPKINSKFEGF
jgi:hypothetical protein